MDAGVDGVGVEAGAGDGAGVEADAGDGVGVGFAAGFAAGTFSPAFFKSIFGSKSTAELSMKFFTSNLHSFRPKQVLCHSFFIFSTFRYYSVHRFVEVCLLGSPQ